MTTPPKRKGGAKGKYTPETVERITQALRMGATVNIACMYAGIDISTFYEWKNTKPEFTEAIRLAEGTGSLALLTRIRKEADEGAWQAAAWILERRYPQEYGRRVQEVTGADGGAITINIVHKETVEEDE